VIWIPDENILKLSNDGETHGATEVLSSMADFDPMVMSTKLKKKGEGQKGLLGY
jgi:hypothetical protein